MIQFVLAFAGVLGALGGIAGTAALVRVFVIDRKVVKREDTEAIWEENRKLRTDLDTEIKNRRKDRVDSDREILNLRTELSNVRTNWDACRAECQRLRAIVEDIP